MKLTQQEKLILHNQYTILEKVYPEQADTYKKAQTILEYGYALEYGNLPGIQMSEMSEESCRETRDIMDMFRYIYNAIDKSEDSQIKDNFKLKFHGFDGNDETKYMSYAEFLQSEGRWTELSGSDGMNSHMPTLERYRSLLAVWRSLPNKFELTDDDLRSLSAAR